MGYRKIVVNGETVVDFSDKVSQDDVVKGRYFYNKKGDIEEGGVDPSGQLFGTAKKFVITPGTTEFRVPHGHNYYEDTYGKPQFEHVFKNVEELVIPESLTTLYPDSFVCGYGEGSLDNQNSNDALKTIKFENFSEFIQNANYIIPTEGAYESWGYHETAWYHDYYTLGWNPWRLASKKPYALLDGDKQIKYLKMPVINDGYLPPLFFANLYIDTLELAEGYTRVEDTAFASCKINRLILPKSLSEVRFPMYYTANIYEIIHDVDNAYYSFSEGGEAMSIVQTLEQSCTNDVTEDGFITLKENSSHLVNYLGMATDITIPNNITIIGDNAFKALDAITNIVIPGNVTNIGNSAFRFCSGLTSVTLENGVTEIGGNAFDSCSDLSSIVIPDSVTSIDDLAFCSCNSLTSITIPNNIKKINYGVFTSCYNLQTVIIPASVTEIDSQAFHKYGGAKMDIYCTSTTPPAIQSNTFNSTYINKIYVPTAEAVTAYKAATNWSKFSSKIVQGVKG